MSDLLLVENLHKSFGVLSVLGGIELSLSSGQVVSLSGANGIGKSTLLSCLSGLLHFNAGQITMSGIGSVKTSKYQQSVGYAGDNSLLYEQLSVEENLRFWMRVYNSSIDAFHKCIEEFFLQKFLKKPVRHCSMGMRRRVSLARSLLHDPKLICWDEPFVGVDAERKSLLQETIATRVSAGSSFIISSHEAIDLPNTATRELALVSGKLVSKKV